MGEVVLRGVSAAPGVAVGKAIVLDRPGNLARKAIAPAERSREAERARSALQAAAADLDDVASRLRESGRNDEADIVETGVLMAADPSLIERVESLVHSGVSAAAAIATATDEIATELSKLTDPTLALRSDDVRSLGRRAAGHADGRVATREGGVLVARTLGPADVAELVATGIALVGGGVTAHAAIVARSLGVPMVVGVDDGALEIADGDEVVLDGDAGFLVRNPDPGRVVAARAKGDRKRQAREAARANRLEPAITTDGRRITVLGNAASVAESIEAGEQGAEGVGLLRTELGFLDVRAWPSY